MKMKHGDTKALLAVVIMSLSTVVWGLSEIEKEMGWREYPPGSQMNERYENNRRLTGGHLIAPDSQKGRVVLLDAQSLVAQTNLQISCNALRFLTKFRFEYEAAKPEELNNPDWPSLLKKYGATAIVALVADKTTPSLLVAPDERWAVINVNKLDRNIAKADMRKDYIRARARKQFVRAIALICGIRTGMAGTPMDINKMEDLDLVSESIPPDEMKRVIAFLKANGMTPKRFVSYRKACQEGWAPQPTDKYQKAVWDKVHELPTKPIKILPETKPVKD